MCMLILVSSGGAGVRAVLLLGCGLVRATRAACRSLAPRRRLVQACSAPRLARQVGKPPREATKEKPRDDKNKSGEREAGVEPDEAVTADEAPRR